MKKLEKFKLESLKLNQFRTIESFEMKSLRGGYSPDEVCGGSGTDDDPYQLYTYTCYSKEDDEHQSGQDECDNGD